jgi:hypothetical protein
LALPVRYDSLTDEESNEPDELLNAKLTLACAPLDNVTG